MSKVNNVDDLKHDLAGTHKPIATTRDVDAELVAADWAHLQTHGYVILEKLIPADICDRAETDAHCHCSRIRVATRLKAMKPSGYILCWPKPEPSTG